ncbi:MAG TPA: hypothetical protein ENJ54_04235 [Chloroflexi bacterium]|nr:hypothetical protein [Chloroflexota bacterium]
MDANFLSALAGVLLSLIFSYVPGARQWYGALDGVHKRLVMLAFLLAAALVVVAVACSGFGPDFQVGVTCDRSGLVVLAKAFITGLATNQATYLVSPPISKG